MKSSPTVQKAVASAFERMQSGQSDKAPTLEETRAKLANARTESIKRSAANLPKLEAELAGMKAIYEKGKNWAMSDRDQNMSPEERQARAIGPRMRGLESRIADVKKAGYKQGGKINLKDCVVNTAEHKNPKHKKF